MSGRNPSTLLNLSQVHTALYDGMSNEPTPPCGLPEIRMIKPITVSKILPPENERAHACYHVPFVCEERTHTFTYNTSDDLSTAVDCFITGSGVNPQYAMPVRLMMDTILGGDKWQFSLERSVPPSYRIPLESDTVDIHDLHEQDVRFTRSATCEEQIVRKAQALPVAYILDYPVQSESAAENVMSSTATNLLTMAFQAALPETMPVVAAKMVSATLVTAARILHLGGRDCPCQRDDIFEHESFYVEAMKQLTSALPSSPQPHPDLWSLRVRHLFECLESTLSALKTDPKRVIPTVRQNRGVLTAISCITEYLDAIHTDHASYVGEWAWNELFLPLDDPVLPSVSKAFYGRTRNQGQKRPREASEDSPRTKERVQLR